MIRFKSEIDVTLIQHCGSDNILAAAAKVSVNPSEAMKIAEVETAKGVQGLINFLMEHRHGSPFEHAMMTFYVHAPILVWREWMRHRIGFSYNEESGRYKKLEPVFYLPNGDRPMMKVDGWKPGRPKFELCDNPATLDDLRANLATQYKSAYEAYEANLEMGIDPGLARDCLPVGIYSACWVTCNPRSLMSFLSLRTYEPTARDVSYPLWEIEVAARKCEAIFAELFPFTHAAFVAKGRRAP